MKQIFQTNNSLRWKKFKWTIRILFMLVFLAITISLLSLYTANLPVLPQLTHGTKEIKKVQNSIEVKQLNNEKVISTTSVRKQLTQNISPHYHFADSILRDKNTNNQREVIKSAFYVNWDPQSYFSLRDNIDRLNTVMPEWFILTNSDDSITTDIDIKALELMQSHHVNIIPMLTNFFNQQWNGENVHRIITNETSRKKIIKSVLDNLNKYHFQGINIDFEDLVETTDEYIILFQKELYECLHKNNFIVTQDISPGNADYNMEELQHYNDYLVIMAYDQHNPSSKPGDIASIKWVESVMDKVTSVVAPEKIILGLCAYGYDWKENNRGEDISFARAMSVAKAHHSEIIFDHTTYSLHFNYKEEKGADHSVYFNDAVSNFNTIRLGYEYNVSGFAAWRLGEEDPRLWSFFNKNLDRNSITDIEHFATELRSVSTKNNVTYSGEGDVLDVVATPTSGVVSIETDSNDKLITEERFEILPCG